MQRGSDMSANGAFGLGVRLGAEPTTDSQAPIAMDTR